MRTIFVCFIFCTLITVLPAAEKIEVQGLSKDWAILKIDGKQRSLRAGEVSPEGVKLISSNNKEALLEIDGEQHLYGIGSAPISTAFSAAKEKASLELYPDARGFYFIDGEINGVGTRFLVDTGASHISMNEIVAKQAGLDYKKGRVGLSSTASGHSKVYHLLLSTVKVGPLEENSIQALVHEGAFPEVVLLGNSFLNRLNLQREGHTLKLSDK